MSCQFNGELLMATIPLATESLEQARSWLSISGGALQKECNRGRAEKFGQCTILGVKKIFPELLIANIAQFFSEYCTTTFI